MMGLRIIAGDLAMGVSFLTRLSVPGAPAQAERRLADAAWTFPLVGALVGALAGAAYLACTALSLPSGFAALAAIAVSILFTGALHEDGLADSFDGLWGGHERERRLQIMRDSAIGSYGVIALIIAIGARAVLLSQISNGETALTILIATEALSRALLAAMMWGQPHARSDGLGHDAGRIQNGIALLCLAIGLAIAALFLDIHHAVLGFVGTFIAIQAWARLVKSRIAGYTGDTLGAGQQIASVMLLLLFQI